MLDRGGASGHIGTRDQCCPLPTSIFSNILALTASFLRIIRIKQPYIDEWKKLGLQFAGISSGFLGSKEQIQIVIRFFEEFGYAG